MGPATPARPVLRAECGAYARSSTSTSPDSRSVRGGLRNVGLRVVVGVGAGVGRAAAQSLHQVGGQDHLLLPVLARQRRDDHLRLASHRQEPVQDGLRCAGLVHEGRAVDAAVVPHLQKVERPGQVAVRFVHSEHHVPAAIALALFHACPIPLGVPGKEEPPPTPLQEQHDAGVVLQPLVLLQTRRPRWRRTGPWRGPLSSPRSTRAARRCCATRSGWRSGRPRTRGRRPSGGNCTRCNGAACRPGWHGRSRARRCRARGRCRRAPSRMGHSSSLRSAGSRRAASSSCASSGN